jgi:hypothetical protein
MRQNLREQISKAIETQLKLLHDPQAVLVTREPFEVAELAITQFPAVLIQARTETRETITMGQPQVGRRMGTITYTIRGFVRGVELDRRRNDLIEQIEESLDTDRYLGLKAEGVTDSQITTIEMVDRLTPLAEFSMEFQVRYNYLRTTT